MKRSIVLTGVVLALAACGGAGDEVGSSGDRAVIESSDGMASLTFSPASLPEGVSIEDIHLERVAAESTDPAEPVVVVQLLPGGLVLSESASLAVTLPQTSASGLSAIHVSGDTMEFLPVTVTEQEGRRVATTAIEHFSITLFHSNNAFKHSLAVSPESVVEGQPQTGIISAQRGTQNTVIRVYFSPGTSAASRTIELSPPESASDLYARLVWEHSSYAGGFWQPSAVFVDMAQVSGGWQSAPGSSVCLKANTALLNYSMMPTYTVTVLGVTETVTDGDALLAKYAHLLTQEDVNNDRPFHGDLELSSMKPGDRFTATGSFRGSFTTLCQALGAATTTTTSTTTPAEEPPEDLDATAGSPQFFDCPIGYQLDIIGQLLSGKEGETSEHIAETPVAKDSNVACTNADKKNPDVFTMMVEGDGETRSTADNTSYQVRFVVNNEWPVNEYYDDTGFEVLVEWNRLAKQWVGVVRDQQGNRLGNDADVTIEWLDSSTLQVAVDVPGLDVEVTEMRTELNVVVTDDNDVRQFTNFDVAIWRKEP